MSTSHEPTTPAIRAATTGAGESRADAVQRKLLAFCLFFVAIGAMPPEALYWDGIGFLERAASQEARLDYGHTLYIPLLQLAHTGLNLVWYATWEFSSKLLSSLGAAVFFVALWSRLERSGARVTGPNATGSIIAFALALLGSTTPLFWRQAGVIEPTTWTLALLLTAALMAERYAERRTGARAAALALATLGMLGFHLVSLFALPWLLWLARGTHGKPPLRHGLALAGSLVVGAGAIVAFGHTEDVSNFAGYWAGFLPAFTFDAAREHARIAWELMLYGMPGPAVAGLAATALVLVRRRRLPAAWILGVPYLLALIVFGQPRVGLIMPVGVALALCTANGIAQLAQAGVARIAMRTGLALLLALQVGQGMGTGLKRARTPDDLQEQAERLAAGLPRASILLAGTVAHHVRWITRAPVVALPNELHGAPGEVAAEVHAIVARELRTHAQVFLSSEALDWLQWRFDVDPGDLRIDAESAIIVREDPLLYLVPFIAD